MKNLKIKIMQECFRSGYGQNIGLAEKWLAWVISKAELEPNFETEKGIVTIGREIPEEWLEFAKKLGIECVEKQTQTKGITKEMEDKLLRLQGKNKFKEVKEAFARGEKIEYCFEDKWYEASAPSWNPKLEYRVKPRSL